ncbi:MAG: PIG-L family deacetylase, partial [Acidimicrobiia bacterium]|nr:PIG-L family deacetylase [Acidimicrobiia bacterium]
MDSVELGERHLMSAVFGASPASALAIYAHPDDPEISAGGTLARWAADGADVWVLITTRGDKGTSDADVDTDELARQRVDETAAAVERLGLAGHYHLEYGDGELVDSAELRGQLVRYVRELAPEVVLCPDPTAVFFGDP